MPLRVSEALAFGYDGSLVTSTTWSGTVSGSVAQTYDDDFRVATQTVAGSSTESFAYDPDGLLIQAGPMSLDRDPLHGLLAGTEVGSVATGRAYNAFGELASDAAQVGTATAYSNSYTRDDLGRITEKTETIQGTTTTYTYHYDPAGRLEQVDENGTPARSYSYDANGNRLAATDHTQGDEVTPGSYDAQDRLQSYGDFTYIYNAHGDLTSKTDTATGETTHYAYDALGNLIQVDLPDGRTLTYVIDGQNRRIGKKVDGVLVKAWLYQDQLNPVAELDGAGNVTARFVYGSRPNVPDLMIQGGATYRILSDHLGSPRLVVDASTGAVAQRLDYDEWGMVQQDTTPGFQPFGFAGGIYDADTGLVRFGARDYDPEVGRWTAKDPIGFRGGSANLFGCSLHDPINNLDLDGRLFRQLTYSPMVGSLLEEAMNALEEVGASAEYIACVLGALGKATLGSSAGVGPLADIAGGATVLGSGVVVAGVGVALGVVAVSAAGTGNVPLAFGAGLGAVELTAAGGAATAVGAILINQGLSDLAAFVASECDCGEQSGSGRALSEIFPDK